MISEKLGKTPAQVALRWGLQMGQSVLPKSTNEYRIKENFDVFDWTIPEDLFVKFSEIEQASGYCFQSAFLSFFFPTNKAKSRGKKERARTPFKETKWL